MTRRQSYPPLLQELAHQLPAIFEQEGVAPVQAERLAAAVADWVRRTWGGLSLYIPKGQAMEKADARDAILSRLRAGEKVADVARSFGITSAAVYRLKRSRNRRPNKKANANE